LSLSLAVNQSHYESPCKTGSCSPDHIQVIGQVAYIPGQMPSPPSLSRDVRDKLTFASAIFFSAPLSLNSYLYRLHRGHNWDPHLRSNQQNAHPNIDKFQLQRSSQHYRCIIQAVGSATESS